jgi:uncharacterized iron-regulated membrane protein
LPRTPTPPYKRTGRKLRLKIHLAIARVVGLELALVGLTGSLLVFYKTIDAWLNLGLLTTNGRGPRAMSAGDTFLLWQHNGEAFGLPGRLAILLSGLSLPLLYVTGLRIWWRKRRAPRRVRHREH